MSGVPVQAQTPRLYAGNVMRLSAAVVKELESALHALRYGSIQLVVHDAKVVRIERIERIRLTDPSEATTVTSGEPTPSREERLHAQPEG